MEQTDWKQMLVAYLHDPPDKVLSLSGHVNRAKKYISDLTGENESDVAVNIAKIEDIKASIEDRLPAPNAWGHWKERAVIFRNRKATDESRLILHPLSGKNYQLPHSNWPKVGRVREEPSIKCLFKEIESLSNDELRFWALWRFMPGVFSSVDPALELLPADTRIPDHTIWNHLDLTAAFKAALADKMGGALISFSLGPVQRFIEQARSLRDLWSGSYLLSWLTFSAMQPIIEHLGPTAIVFPGLRGNPLVDHWISSKFEGTSLKNRFTDSAQEKLLVASLPNTFMAIVPFSEADELMAKSKNNCQNEWLEICNSVHGKLTEQWKRFGKWDTGWQSQVEPFWDMRSVSLPLQIKHPQRIEELKTYFESHLWKECWPSQEIDTIDRVMREKEYTANTPNAPDTRNAPGSWSMHVELIRRLMSADKQIRHILPHSTDDNGGNRPKCTLLGSLEQMGPVCGFKNQADFWSNVSAEEQNINGTHIRESERLCAVALVKRFAWAAYFSGKLNRKPSQIRYSDTATVAAAEWLKSAVINPNEIRQADSVWNGQWAFQTPLQWETSSCNTDSKHKVPAPPRSVQEQLKIGFQAVKKGELERPRPYYASFILDGDEMGKLLRGEKAPSLRQSYHPKLVRYFESLGNKDVSDALNANRPLSPAQHAAMTMALGHFSRELVPDIVEEHSGELIYSGGDDALAVLPTKNAVSCLQQLRAAFSGPGNETDSIPKGWVKKNNRILLMMGDTASVSGGLVVAHYKADLRDVLQAARDAEKSAKQSGRNAIGIAIMRRSGEHSLVVCPWCYVANVENLVTAFVSGASDRWSYRLSAESQTMGGLPRKAIASIIRQTVDRTETSTREKLGNAFNEKDIQKIGKLVSRLYMDFGKVRDDRAAVQNESVDDGQILKDFVVLVQTASFLARGGAV